MNYGTFVGVIGLGLLLWCVVGFFITVDDPNKTSLAWQRILFICGLICEALWWSGWRG